MWAISHNLLERLHAEEKCNIVRMAGVELNL